MKLPPSPRELQLWQALLLALALVGRLWHANITWSMAYCFSLCWQSVHSWCRGWTGLGQKVWQHSAETVIKSEDKSKTSARRNQYKKMKPGSKWGQCWAGMASLTIFLDLKLCNKRLMREVLIFGHNLPGSFSGKGKWKDSLLFLFMSAIRNHKQTIANVVVLIRRPSIMILRAILWVVLSWC